MLRVELDREDWPGVVDDPLVGLVVLIGEENGPIRGQRVRVDGKTMVLCGDEAALCVLVYTRLVVATVTIPVYTTHDTLYHTPNNGCYATMQQTSQVGRHSLHLEGLGSYG